MSNKLQSIMTFVAFWQAASNPFFCHKFPLHFHVHSFYKTTELKYKFFFLLSLGSLHFSKVFFLCLALIIVHLKSYFVCEILASFLSPKLCQAWIGLHWYSTLFVHWSDKRNLKEYFMYNFVSFWRESPQWGMASSFRKFLNYTQRRTTVGRTPLDESSARFRELYLTTHNNRNWHTSISRCDSNPQNQQRGCRRCMP